MSLKQVQLADARQKLLEDNAKMSLAILTIFRSSKISLVKEPNLNHVWCLRSELIS